jgi:hypothetical protein
MNTLKSAFDFLIEFTRLYPPTHNHALLALDGCLVLQMSYNDKLIPIILDEDDLNKDVNNLLAEVVEFINNGDIE